MDFLWLIWYVPGGGGFGPMLGRRRSCWADVGPLAVMFSRLLGTFHDGSLWWYCILLSVNLCIVYSYFHVCFICSLTIILCVIKTVQPTPLVVSEPGRYNIQGTMYHAYHLLISWTFSRIVAEWCNLVKLTYPSQYNTGLLLSLCPANERRRYKVTPSLIGWAQA